MGFLSERLTIDSIEVEVRRSSRRKTRIGLAFDPAGLVILEAPLEASFVLFWCLKRRLRRLNIFMCASRAKFSSQLGRNAFVEFESGYMIENGYMIESEY